VAALTMRMCRSWTRIRTWVRAWVRPMPMWWSRPAWRRVTTPVASTRSRRTRSWVSASRLAAGVALGRGGVDGGGGGPLRQRPVRAVLVIELDEGVEEALQLADRGGLDRLGGQPLLHGLLESFGFAAGGGVVGAGVLLHHAEAAQLVLERVAAAAAAGVAGGVDHRVIGQRGRGDAVLSCGVGERVGHDRPRSPAGGRSPTTRSGRGHPARTGPPRRSRRPADNG
jgi:hypothetical protein